MTTKDEIAKDFRRSRERMAETGKEKYREVLRKQGVPDRQVDSRISGNAWTQGVGVKGKGFD